MSAYAGPVCGRCNKGMIGDQGLVLSDDWETRLNHKYDGSLCDTCKRDIMMQKIKDRAALPWDLPGHEHTNAL